MANLEPLMERNFLEYASYVIVDRAIPDLRDGCKPVQRRILQTLHEMDDGKFHKVANVIGETMKLHPHGDASIGDALVVLANKDYFIEKQGNFGNVVTGHPAAAPRYIECRLNDLARETMFNKALTQFQPSYDGRKDEPIFLPVKLPVLLLLGTEGIAVGMSTKIFPHNLVELLQAQIAILEKKPFEVLPDFISGGQIDVSEYNSGLGKVRVRAKTEITSERKIVIKEIPYATTTESLISSIELAAQKGRVQVSSINDFTTDHVEIELIPSRGVDPREVVPQLFAYTDCEVSLTSNIVTIQDQRPVELSTDNVLRFLTEQLKEQIRAELEFEINKLQSQRHWLTLERIFIEKRVYKRIEEAKTSDQVKAEVHTGMKLYRKQFIRSMTDEDVGRLLEIRIRRISRYDIEKTRQQLKEIDTQIKGLKGKLARLKKTTIELLENIIEKYGPDYPRKTEIAEFESVVRKTVALQDIKVSYDPETGFFGSAIKGSKYQMTVSEFDRILFVSKDGTYRIVDPAKKILIPDKVLHCSLFDQEEGRTFTVIYRDEKRMAFAKKVHIQKFIRQKEYSLVPGKKGKLDFLLPGDTTGIFQLNFVPAKNQRVHEGEFDIGILEITNPLAKGRRMATKPVARIIRFTKEELQALKRKRKRRSAKR